MKSGIYLISASKGTKTYVGSSKNIKNRISYHWSALRHNRHSNKKLQNYFNKHGLSSIIFCILEECEISLLEEREIYYAQQLKPWFNIIKDIKRQKGDFTHTKQTKNKIKKASLKLWNDSRDKMLSCLKSGENNGFSKLTNKQVKEIKHKLLCSDVSIVSICKEYSVSKTLILQIKQGKWWRHITPELNDDIKKVKRKRNKCSPRIITKETIELIKLDIITNSFSIQQLSEKYSVSYRNITAIKHIQNYKDIREDLNILVKNSTFVVNKCKPTFNPQTVETKKKNHSLGKLTIKQIKEIKEYKKQGYTNKELAKMYFVHTNTISYLNTGKTFKWLNNAE